MSIGVLFGVYWFFFRSVPMATPVTFFVQYNGTSIATYTGTEGGTIEEALRSAGYPITEETYVFPEKTNTLKRGTLVLLRPATVFTVVDHEETKTFTKPARTVQEALEVSGTTLNGADFVEPSLETAMVPGLELRVTRVTVTEETEDTKIPFQKGEEEDDSLSFRVKKVAQKGESGVRTTTYKVSRHNGKIVAKEKLSEVITKEPVEEKTVIGTKVTVVKKHTGGASWYAHTGTLAAANPWLPFGSYVRVTNTSNGKSVIVTINDRGPFGPGRIIDLDKVAFAKIADLGTGVINVVMEEIK